MFNNLLEKAGFRQKVNFSCVKVIYKSKSGAWRGFIEPFDLTIEADTCKEASEALDEMLDAYQEVLEEYDRPSHLANKTLSVDEDHDKFLQLIEAGAIKEGGLKTDDLYVETKTL